MYNQFAVYYAQAKTRLTSEGTRAFAQTFERLERTNILPVPHNGFIELVFTDTASEDPLKDLLTLRIDDIPIMPSLPGSFLGIAVVTINGTVFKDRSSEEAHIPASTVALCSAILQTRRDMLVQMRKFTEDLTFHSQFVYDSRVYTRCLKTNEWLHLGIPISAAAIVDFVNADIDAANKQLSYLFPHP